MQFPVIGMKMHWLNFYDKNNFHNNPKARQKMEYITLKLE